MAMLPFPSPFGMMPPYGGGVMGPPVPPMPFGGAGGGAIPGGLLKAIQAAMEGNPTGGLFKKLSDFGAAPPGNVPGLLGALGFGGGGAGGDPSSGYGGLSGLM